MSEISGTTNINDLPTSPQQVNPEENVVLEKSENVKIDNSFQNLQQQRQEDIPPSTSATAIDNQKMMNNLVTGLQQASASGVTELSSRDIPIDTSQMTSDAQIKPNFVPQAPADYIAQQESPEEMIMNNTKSQNKKDSLEILYEELQVPILLAALFFLFQLPALRKGIFKFIPSLFNKDGNPNIYGYIFNSILFAVLYYIFDKLMKHFSVIQVS